MNEPDREIQQEHSCLKGMNDMQLNSSPCTVHYIYFGAT